LSDGTGNSSAKIFKTNVWRLYQALDLTDSTRQVAYYDNGVGTSSFKLFAALGGVFGIGLKRNVVDIYCFACRNFKRDDKLYGFGFSRGAFTMRIVAGFIARIGLVRYNGNEADLRRDAVTAYRAYRKARGFRSGFNLLVAPTRAIRDFFSHTILRKPTIDKIERIHEKFHFLGVWDTVGAYGGPIEEITLAIDYFFWPLSMPDGFMNNKVTRACHALALEEERDSFMPVLWDERYVRASDGLRKWDDGWRPDPADPAQPLAAIDQERISQVWFVGVHSDIGGGYPQDGLSYVSLQWMMERTKVYGLTYLPVQVDLFRSLVGPYDRLNDSRTGFAGYYRYRPRDLRHLYDQPPYKLSFGRDIARVVRLVLRRPDPETELQAELAPGTAYDANRPAPKIHQAVFDRIAKGNDGYAPIVMAQKYGVVRNGGVVTSNVATPAGAQEAISRTRRQGQVWDWVWVRRVLYFLTMFASLYLLLLPVIDERRPGPGAGSFFEFVIPVIDMLGVFLPRFASPWLDAFRNSPGRFLLGVVLMLLFMYFGARAQGRIRDLMRAIWATPGAPFSGKRSLIYRLRSAGWYRAFFYVLKHWLLPAFFALILATAAVLGIFYLASRLFFAGFDAAGWVCRASPQPTAVTEKSAEKRFETAALCTATGLAVERGKTYQVTVTLDAPWEDGFKFGETNPIKAKGIESGADGFGFDKMTAPMWFGLLLRRELGANWFATILRVGHKGFGEFGLPLERVDPLHFSAGPVRYKAQFRARRSGEVFVYVNDAVVGFPGWFDLFYRPDPWTKMTNKGDAKLTLELVPAEQ